MQFCPKKQRNVVIELLFYNYLVNPLILNIGAIEVLVNAKHSILSPCRWDLNVIFLFDVLIARERPWLSLIQNLLKSSKALVISDSDFNYLDTQRSNNLLHEIS